MFSKKIIEELKNNISNIESSFHALKRDLPKELLEDISEFKTNVRKELNDYIEKRLFELKREMTDEYYNVLNKLIEFNKTLFMSNDKKRNIVDDLEQFLLQQKWDKEKNRNGEKILNKGAEIIDRRKKLYDEILAKERQNEKPERINLLKAKLEAYDSILKEIK